jgi:hypothetical protein
LQAGQVIILLTRDNFSSAGGWRRTVSMRTELSRVAELADRLADRTLVAFEQGALSTEEFRASPDVALVLDSARLLHAAGAEFPAGVVRLAQKAAEQTQL